MLLIVAVLTRGYPEVALTPSELTMLKDAIIEKVTPGVGSESLRVYFSKLTTSLLIARQKNPQHG